jgi:hypothetical protein
MKLTNVVDELRKDHPWLDVFGVQDVTSNAIVVGDAWKIWGPHYAGSGPLGVTVHHTASDSSWRAILDFEWSKYANVKATNCNISPEGRVAVMSAGSAATNGSGLTLHQFSRGLGGRNGDQWTIEVHNPGTGAWPYPEAQMRAILAVCYTVNRLSGNQWTDVTTHHEIAPDRKTDPAPAHRIEGPYNIRSVGNRAGTWNADDLRAEALRFAQQINQGDWLDMATEAQVRAIVAEESQKAASRNIWWLLGYDENGNGGPDGAGPQYLRAAIEAVVQKVASSNIRWAVQAEDGSDGVLTAIIRQELDAAVEEIKGAIPPQ